MAWFRHEDNARNDKRIRALVDEFGPLGELVWHRLLEVRCQADDDIEATIEELVQDLSLRTKWRFPLERWLDRAVKLGLIEVRKRRTGRVCVHIGKWDEYQPEWATKKAAAERQRRSRAQRSQKRHSDSSVTSHSTDGRTDGVAVELGEQQQQESVSKPPDDLVGEVVGYLEALGVDHDTAVELVGEDVDECRRQLGWIGQRAVTSNAAGLLIAAIRGRYPEPGANGTQRGRDLPDFTGSGHREATV